MFLILWKIGRLEITSFIWNFTDRKEMMSKTCNVYIVSRNAFSNLEIRRLDPGLIIKKGLSGNIWCFSKSGLNPHLNYSLMTVVSKSKMSWSQLVLTNSWGKLKFSWNFCIIFGKSWITKAAFILSPKWLSLPTTFTVKLSVALSFQ